MGSYAKGQAFFTITVTIRDGAHVIAWGIDPKVKPDVYYTDLPRANTTITFISDMDSLSFTPHYGDVYNFVILLNGTDSCFTRVSANYQYVVPVVRRDTLAPADTIPFTLRQGRVYVTGNVNGHDGIAMMLDLGAGMACVNIHSIEKAGIHMNTKPPRQILCGPRNHIPATPGRRVVAISLRV